ncbi:hypothetical protein EDC44_12918 [Cricetibacter osteomyelitidis]|uniref:Uncharacterized protein n=1 Tax=Cricetibacter osteomyelitidis TaxID=1521931 RepID=A0A4R2STK5_9PAST|nr:hypothetical protein [Cricetibacter osteomyelitidis]TCP92041.1 hypothetical protein EDC44_12918 [Cricetibacter osteomyelitidis]
MSTTLKVLSAKKVIASHQIEKGNPLIIDARDKSNYQLIDDSTGLGPQNIIAKREGNDLKVFLEDGDMSADVIIKNYYDDQTENTSNLLVGQHENGNIYAYVPESGIKTDAVSMLAEEVIAPQALGGEEIGAFWAFNPWWLLALAPIAAGIAIAASSGGSDSGNNGGNSKPNTPRVPGDVDGDGDADDNDNDTTTEKGAPKVSVPEAEDGFINKDEADSDGGVPVEVTLPKNTKEGDTVTVIVTKPDGSKTEVPHVVTGTEESAGKVAVTIPTTEIATDGDYKVSAKVTTPDGQSSKESAEVPFKVDQTAPAAPDAEAQTDGSVTVTPKDENPVTVKYTDENGKEQEFTVKKDDTGNWVSEGKPENVTIDSNTGKVTISATEVKDDSTVTATSNDPAGNTAKDEAEAKTPEITEKPIIDITEIAGDTQAADFNDDGTAATQPSDIYAQISPAEAAGGFLIRGTSKDITDGITVTISEKGGTAIVTKTATLAEDGSWSVMVDANSLTDYSSTKEYEVKASGTSATGVVEDIDYTASTPQVTEIKLKDNLTDEPLVDGTYQYTDFYTDGDAKYVGDVSSATGLSTATSLATGLTNDKAAVLEFTLDKAPVAGQVVKVYRYELSENSTEYGKTDVSSDMTTSDDLTYTVIPKGDNVLKDTYSQGYRYEVVIEDKNGDELSTGAKGTFDFRLDSLVEQMSVEKFDINTGEVVFAPTGLSEVNATIEYRYATGSGKSEWVKVEADASGKYNLKLTNFDRFVAGALEIRTTDAAGNVSESKVSLLRNLFSDLTTEGGPLTNPNKDFDQSLITNGNILGKQKTGTAAQGAITATDDNDTIIVGLDYKPFGGFGVSNGSIGSTVGQNINVDLGAGNDSLQARGTAQSMNSGRIAMGSGSDRISIDKDLLIGGYTFDLGQIEDKTSDTNILYVGGNTNNAINLNIYGGAGNDAVHIDGTMDGNKTVNLGEGHNELRVGYGTSSGGDLTKKIDFTAGSGDDIISVKGSINTIAGQTQKFDLGDGNNFIEVGKNVDTDGTFTFGNGTDTVNIKGTLKGGIFAFGDGDDSVTVGSILKSGTDNVKIDMGNGDDVITVTGTGFNTGNGAINGGEGNDTIFLHGADLKLDMSQVLNVETIDMRTITGGTGNQKVAFTLADLQRTGDSITKLYIKGDAGDTVDFGNNNGNGTNNAARTDSNGNTEYWDNGGTREIKNNWAVWEKTGSDIVENGIVYDKYTYKGPTGQVNDEEVYIQQGVNII